LTVTKDYLVANHWRKTGVSNDSQSGEFPPWALPVNAGFLCLNYWQVLRLFYGFLFSTVT